MGAGWEEGSAPADARHRSERTNAGAVGAGKTDGRATKSKRGVSVPVLGARAHE